MSRTAYVNGRYLPHGQAVVHIEDRGFQFADAVYEVWSVFEGRLGDYAGHMRRLERSLGELKISPPMSEAALSRVLRETLRRNRVREGICYLQISRGTARRDHAFPGPEVAPSIVVTARSIDRAAEASKAERGVAVITTPEARWARCDIKTVGLLPNALAKQAARERGAAEAWFVDELGFVTEGASTNAWIVDADGVLRTRDTNANILRGVTRHQLVDLAREEGVEVSERPFSVDDVKAAREAFFTAASAFITPVVSIDAARIGDGRPGPISNRLRALYMEKARAEAI